MADVRDYITAARALRLDEWDESLHPRAENGQFGETGDDDDDDDDDEEPGDPSGIDPKDLDVDTDWNQVYWRLQDSGFTLSSSHRSETYSEDPDDPGQKEAGTSAAPAFAALHGAQANLRTKEIEVVGFVGTKMGKGWDGEPVVSPEKELVRFRKSFSDIRRKGMSESLMRIKSLEDFEKEGWTRVASPEVKP